MQGAPGLPREGSAGEAGLPPSSATGALGIPHLRRLWASAMAIRSGRGGERAGEAYLDRIVLDALGLGLHQTWEHLLHAAPAFDAFEAWVVATAGLPDPDRVERLRALVAGDACEPLAEATRAALERMDPVLTPADLEHWAEHGYVVLDAAISEAACRAVMQAIYTQVDASPEQPESWYRGGGRHGIMVELVQHAALEPARRSPRIHKAFAQLWGTAELWASADRCGFHPPQRPGHPFPGPDLHWDLDFDEPLHFGTQGILYLTDTPAEQGALAVVPGFHRHLPAWLAALGPGQDPQQQDLHALGPRPIAGRAGDLVIWHQWLPHGASPNRGTRPRIVQYINFLAGMTAATAAVAGRAAPTHA